MDIQLTARDLDLFQSLKRFRFLTTEQVQRLHFPSRQTMLRRVRVLARSGHLTTFPAHALGTRAVAIGRRGAETIAGAGEKVWVPRREARSELFLAHTVSINEFRIGLEDVCRRAADCELLGFITEAERSRGSALVSPEIADTVSALGASLSRVPDGVFALRRQERAALFLLEVDRSTEVVLHPERGLARAIRFYAAYLATDRYQKYAAIFGVGGFRGFRALFVFRTQQRLDSVRQRCGRLPDLSHDAKRFIWLATEAGISSQQLTGTPWVSLDPDDATSYGMFGSRRAEESQ